MTAATSTRKRPRYVPGSITEVSSDELHRAWDRRETDPDTTRSVLLSARALWRLQDIADELGQDVNVVRPFATPAISTKDARILREAFDNGHVVVPGSDTPAGLPTVISTFHEAGWSYSQIARVLGVSRQSVHQRLTTAKAAGTDLSVDHILLERIDKRSALPLSHRDRVPAYAVDPRSGSARVPMGIVPAQVMRELGRRHTRYRTRVLQHGFRRGTVEKVPTSLLRARSSVHACAKQIVDEYAVTYTQLSVALGLVDKYELSRIARDEGEDVYVPSKVSRP